ncbi:MAG: glycosyltransferase family 4 protein [Bacteroidota bacterium]
MKLLFLTDNFPPEVNAPATRTFEHCVEWVKAGVDVTVITCAPNFPQGKLYPGFKNKLIQRETIEGIKVIRVWTYIAENKGFLRRTLDYMSFMMSSFFAGLTIRADVIIATSPQFFTVVSGFLLSFFKRTPWVMEVRDLWPASILEVEAVKTKWMLFFFFWLEKRLYRSADMIVPVTETFKMEIIKKGIDPSKIHVITNGSNLDLFSPRKPNLALKDELRLTDRFVVSYIGTHGLAHCLEFVVQCAPELDRLNISLLFIGDGARKRVITELVKSMNLKNVVLLNPAPKEQVPEYLSISDISIIPLKKADIFTKVIPSKIFESAAMEIPILLGVDGESRNLIEKYNAGLFFEPENKTDFLEKMQKFVQDKHFYEQCKLGGRKLASDYARKKLARDFLARITEVDRAIALFSGEDTARAKEI